MEDLWSNVLPALGVLLSVLLTWLARKAADWLNIRITAENEALLRLAVQAAVHGAEEWAAQRLKAESIKTTAEQKFDHAALAIKTKFPHLAKFQIDELIQSEVGRAAGLGASARQGFRLLGGDDS